MAQTGFTPILLYSSSTTTNAPAVGNLTNSASGSELAINITDGKLFYKDNANAIQVIGWKTTPTTAGGTGLTTYTAGDLSYYASGTTLTKLGIGASATILTSTGSAPQWSATSGIAVGTATNLAGGLAGSVPYQTGAGATTFLGIGATGRFLSSTGSAPQWSAPAALTETDDTNVTMTLGGTPSTALLSSVSMTLGWTGQLAVGRGGTGASTFTAGRILFGNTTSAINTSANLYWDNTNGIFSLNTTTGSLVTGYAVQSRGDITMNNSDDANRGTTYNMGLGDNGITGYYRAKIAYIPSSAANKISCNIAFFNKDGDLGSSPLTERMRIHTSGGVSIGNTTDPGAGVLFVASGVRFPATQVASADANTLDDYEEGTWTPTITGLTLGNASGQSFAYVKVGNIVTVTLAFIWGSTTSSSGTWEFSVPFSADVGGGGSAYLLDSGTAEYMVSAGIAGVSFAGIRIGTTATGFVSNTAPFTWATNDRFVCSVTYRTS